MNTSSKGSDRLPIVMGLYPKRRTNGQPEFKSGLLDEVETCLRVNPWYAETAYFLAADSACKEILSGLGLKVERTFQDAPDHIWKMSAHRMKLWMTCWAADVFGECLWVDWDTISLGLPDHEFTEACRRLGTPKFIKIEGYKQAVVNNGLQYCPRSWTRRLRDALAQSLDVANDENIWESLLPDDAHDRDEFWFGNSVQYISKPKAFHKVTSSLRFVHLGGSDFRITSALRKYWLSHQSIEISGGDKKGASSKNPGPFPILTGGQLHPLLYRTVGKFHAPGLAPFQDKWGAGHIDESGLPAYANRFQRTFGFYENKAAVLDRHGWFHIDPTGNPLYAERYEWAGNYQEDRVTVRHFNGHYGYLDSQGKDAHNKTYIYAGDYRDGIACVRNHDGLCRHVDLDGNLAHRHPHHELDVYHKGFARARDIIGWYHIGKDGLALYSERYADLEPFYNGQAKVLSLAGINKIIDESGKTIRVINKMGSRKPQNPGVVVFVIGNICAGKTSLVDQLSRAYGFERTGIDDCRRSASDGSAVGELRAWTFLMQKIQSSGRVLVEISGSGPFIPLLKRHLEEQSREFRVVWIRTPIATCLKRLETRELTVPYPEFGTSIKATTQELEERIEKEIAGQRYWPVERVHRVDGELSMERQVKSLSKLFATFGQKEVSHE